MWAMPRSLRHRLIARPACPPPMTMTSVCIVMSFKWEREQAEPHRPARLRPQLARACGVHVDCDRDALGDHVEHGGTGACLGDDLGELLGRGVALDVEAQAHALVAVADLVGETEDAAQIHVALD